MFLFRVLTRCLCLTGLTSAAKRRVGIVAGSICVCPFRYKTRFCSFHPLLPSEGLALWQDQFASVLSGTCTVQGSEFTTAAKRRVDILQDQFASVLSGTVQGSKFTTAAKRKVGIVAGSICVCPFRYSTRCTNLQVLPREGLALLHCGRINMRLSFQVQHKVQSLPLLPREGLTLWQASSI